MSKEEFTSDKIKASLEKWVGPIEDLEAEFDSIDTNAGGQVPNININTIYAVLDPAGLIKYAKTIENSGDNTS